MENVVETKLKGARQRVERIKSFYNHVVVFVIINGALLLLKDEITIAIFGEEALGDSRLMHWVDVNVYIWVGILIIHGIIVFGGIQNFVKKWEESEVDKILQKEKEKKYE